MQNDVFEQTISRNLGSLGPSEAIHANTYQNPYLAKNPEAIYGRVLQRAKPVPSECGDFRRFCYKLLITKGGAKAPHS